MPQLIFMRRSKVSLIFNGVSGETFHDSPDAGKYNWNTARHTNVLVPFMSRSKVSLIFDGVSGETFMIRLMPENTTGILLDTRIYFDCLMFPAISFTAECKGPSECISSVFFQRRFMSRSKVSLIFDGVSGETFMIRLMPENTTGILLDTRIYFGCCSLPFHSPQSQCEAGVDELRF